MKKILMGIKKEFTHPIRRWGYLFILPGIIYYSIVMAYPIGTGLFLSFHKWYAFTGTPKFTGIKNFIELFQDEVFWLSLRNTIYYTSLCVPFSVVIPLFLAILLSEKFPLKNFFRTIYFLPTITSIVAIGVVWAWLYQPTFGLLNDILKHLGLPSQMWIRDKRLVIPCLAIVFIWFRIGFNMVLFLAGITGIPNVLYEAATIDGASRTQQIFRITLPLLFPTTIFLLITTTIYSFQVFDLVFVMTKGGPGNASRTVGFEIYERAFSFFEVGPAMAETVVLFGILLAITSVQLQVEKKLRVEF